MSERLPIVGVPCDRRMLGDHAFDVVGEKYIEAVRGGARSTPFLIPSLGTPLDPAEIIPHVDGLMFTGSPSNVAPDRYDGEAPRPGTLLDEARDAVTLPLLRAGVAAGLPMLCICRGFQELNVALGGTLHQHVRELEGRQDHSVGDRKRSLERQYGPAHRVSVTSGGVLQQLLPTLGPDLSFEVNSLHNQGIDRLAPGLVVEAVAPDGTIEAVSLKTAKAFLLGVQWHPEWKYSENPVSREIYAAFGAALRRHAQMRGKAAVP